MAKEIDWATLVYQSAGPKPKEPTYNFGRKQFYETPKPPGQSTNNVDSNKSV